MEKIVVQTHQKTEMIEITSKVKELVNQKSWKSGLLCLFSAHTTAALTVNENADPDVKRDITWAMDQKFPNDPNFRHAEGNSDAHLKTSLFGPSLTLIIENGRIQLGTWQGIYVNEWDGARKREVWAKFVGTHFVAKFPWWKTVDYDDIKSFFHMGNKPITARRLLNHEINELIRGTDFSREEVQHWFNDFFADYPTGYMTFQDLRRILAEEYPCGNPLPFAEMMFSLFDQDKDGQISFAEFLKGIYVLGRRDSRDKAIWLFPLLDSDNDGYLSEEDLLPFVYAAKALSGYETENPIDDVKRLVQRLDKDCDGRISAKEFSELGSVDHHLTNALSLFYLPFKESNDTQGH